MRRKPHLQYFRRVLDPTEIERERTLLRYKRSDALPIWKEDLPPGLTDLSVAKGIQGNFFKVTPAQWETLMEYIGGWPEDDIIEKEPEPMPNPTDLLNEILYGPPGTGKTYESVSRAVQRIESIKGRTRKEVQARFAELRRERRIEFVTFHQSYGYEDFLEGLRPMIPLRSSVPFAFQIKSRSPNCTFRLSTDHVSISNSAMARIMS